MSTPFWVALLKAPVAAAFYWLLAVLKKKWSAYRAPRCTGDAVVIHEHTPNTLHRLGPLEQSRLQHPSATSGVQEGHYTESA